LNRVAIGFGASALLLGAVPFLGLAPFYESFLYLVFHWVVLAT
jgi:branched-chain amino acid transport system permease protein